MTRSIGSDQCNIYTYVNNIYLYIYTCYIYTCVYTYLFVCACVCVCALVCVCVCVCTLGRWWFGGIIFFTLTFCVAKCVLCPGRESFCRDFLFFKIFFFPRFPLKIESDVCLVFFLLFYFLSLCSSLCLSHFRMHPPLKCIYALSCTRSVSLLLAVCFDQLSAVEANVIHTLSLSLCLSLSHTHTHTCVAAAIRAYT